MFLDIDEAKPVGMIVSVVFLLAGVGMTAYAFKAHVGFSTDAIELTTLIGVRRLPLSAIRGRREYVVRTYRGGSTRYLKLESDDDRFPALDFSRNYELDDAFYKWFYSLPDLDAKDREVHEDKNFGLI